MSSIRIISGEFRSRTLVSPPDGEVTRPFLGRVKESVFSMLQGWFEDASVLDLFAGVGTVGLEAVSRGARRVIMVEQNPYVFSLLEQNVETLGCEDRVTTISGDALGPSCLARVEPPVDLVFVDPPYELVRQTFTRRRVIEQVGRCRELMGDRGFLVLRTPKGPQDLDLSVPGWEGPESHRYGHDQWVNLYAPGDAPRAAGDEMPTETDTGA